MRAVIFVTFALIAGCTSSFEKVKTMRAEAPDWYEARKVEFRGEGYPSLASVPKTAPSYNPLRKLELSEADVRAALVRFNNDPRAEGVTESAESMRAWALNVRRAVEGRLPAPDFMTDVEADEIKARFNVPRARL